MIRPAAIFSLVATLLLHGAPTMAQTNEPERPPTGHLAIFGDPEADLLEHLSKVARREGRIEEAVALTWQLNARIEEVLGGHQTIQWNFYTSVVEMWLDTDAPEKAVGVLDRMITDLGPKWWFDDFERGAVSLMQGFVHVRAAEFIRAETSYREGFAYVADLGSSGDLGLNCAHRRFADVLEKNGNPREALEHRQIAGTTDQSCDWRL